MREPVFDLAGKRVWVAGHTGLVGSALIRRLADEPVAEVLTADSRQLDLRQQAAVHGFVARNRPDVLMLAAARVGGIHANNSAQGEFLYDNLMIAANCIEAARVNEIQRSVIFGSSCIYPREAPQPIREDALLTGPLEPTNEGYAVAKIAALELGKMYRRQYGMSAINLMPTNLYGPGDNLDLSTSHVLPAILRKVHEASSRGTRTVELWGTGEPRREFLFVDDLADAAVHVLRYYDSEEHLNVGTGKDISIIELARLIADVIGWDGEFVFDVGKPDGAPRKLLEVSRLSELGWHPRVGLREGIRQTYAWLVSRDPA